MASRALLALVLVLLALVAGLSALWYWPSWGLAGWVGKASAGRAQVLWVQGSLAQGQAQLGLYDGRVLRALPGLWQWRLCLWACPQPVAPGQANPNGTVGAVGVVAHAAWAGGLGLNLAHPSLGAGLQAVFTRQGVQLGPGQVQWPAAWLAGLGAPFNTLGPTGSLQLRWQVPLQWRWASSTTPPMALVLQWQEAGLALSPVRPLGQWQLTALGTPQEGFTLELSSQQGPLWLSGSGRWQPGQGLNFAAYATPQAQDRAALQGLLQQVAQAEGERYRIRLF